MPDSPDKWKIRFGQIFQELLKESGKKLEDYFYFIPTGSVLDPHSEESYNAIDLDLNRDVYAKYFSGDTPSVLALDKDIVTRLNATLIIVPGFGHHLIKTKAFDEVLPLLNDLGFRVLYAFYEDSFESNEKCARRVYQIIKSQLDDQQKMIFFTYSKGSPVVVEMLADPRYVDVASRTKAVVSFAGALRGSPHTSSLTGQTVLVLLKAYRRLSQRTRFATNLFEWIQGEMKRLKIDFFERWKELVEKVKDFADDLIDLPEGIEDLTRVTSESKYADVHLMPSIKLFSISAVCPEAIFKHDFKFITNPDDLFLYISGRELYKYNVFNDTQVLLPDSEFFEGTGDIIHLGVVKVDHWGIALPYVFSDRYVDPFPRVEMLKAVLLILDEYFQQLHKV